MQCPKCKNEMEIFKKDISNNGKEADVYREYERTIYWCKQDDIWMNIEIPKKHK